MKTGYIIGLSLGHNGGVCLLKDGEIVFSIEEERLTRVKADAAPFKGLLKVLEYTDKVDYIAVAYPANDKKHVEYTREPVYLSLARKVGLLPTLNRWEIGESHPNYIEYYHKHHEAHAACAFYRSGFETAATVVIDGAGSGRWFNNTQAFEVETIFDCSIGKFVPKYKKYGYAHDSGKDSLVNDINPCIEEKDGCTYIVDFGGGIGKAYDAITDILGFDLLEAGKTMGLSAYGKPNPLVPNIFIEADWPSLNNSFIQPAFFSGSKINYNKYKSILENVPKQDLAYKVQTETQEQALKLLIKASEITGHKNICLTGGYALNCVANYYYKDKLNELGINLYIEPNSSDAGTAIGVAFLAYYDKKDGK